MRRSAIHSSEKEVKGLPFRGAESVNLLTLQPGVTGYRPVRYPTKTFLGSPLRVRRKDGVGERRCAATRATITLDGVDANNWETQAAFTSALAADAQTHCRNSG